jgi:hypothetical protein
MTDQIVDSVVADTYLKFKDFYSTHYYFSTFPTYSALDDEAKTFWTEFIKSILHRCSIESAHKRKLTLDKPI